MEILKRFFYIIVLFALLLPACGKAGAPTVENCEDDTETGCRTSLTKQFKTFFEQL